MRFCWVTVAVSDMEASLRFYRDFLGLGVSRRIQPRPGMEIAFLGSGGTEVELIHDRSRTGIAHGTDISMGFVVESLDETVARLAEAGIEGFDGPYSPGPGIAFGYVSDPDGVRIQLVEQTRI